MRAGAWLLGVALLAGGCDDENLDDFDTQRRVTRPPATRFDAVFQFTPRDRIDGADAAAAPTDAAPADADTGADAGSDATPGPDASTLTCAQDGDCLLAVNLITCDPCPAVTNRAHIADRMCIVEYVAQQSIFGYGIPECVQGCQFNDNACLDAPRGAECTNGRCVPIP